MINLSYLKELLTGQGRLAVGYSGGVDSTALLHACHSADVPVLAIHVNHQLQAPANDWEAHCEAFCHTYGIPFEARRVSVPRLGGESLEENARQQRYAALADVMQTHGINHLLTAHHEDDQIETVLIALFRGSGFAGLAGMSQSAPWPFRLTDSPLQFRAELPIGNLLVTRPLLATKKSDLYQYAALHNLSFVEDPSNEDLEYRRNWLRNRLIPELAQAFPQYRASIRRLARQVNDIRQEWDEQAQALLRECSDDLKRLSLARWRGYSAPVRLRVMRTWLASHNIRLNEQQSLELERQLQVSHGGIRQVCSACKLRVKGAWVQCVTDSS